MNRLYSDTSKIDRDVQIPAQENEETISRLRPQRMPRKDQQVGGDILKRRRNRFGGEK